jgi:hypothetical protein
MSSHQRKRQTSNAQAPFSGFDQPSANWFRMPDNWTDITAGITNIAALKVVEYILRHTWGYREYGIKKHITVDEFVHGRKHKNGERMDRGTGLSERAVRYGLQHALADGLIEEDVDDSDRARVKKYYSLKMKDEADPEAEPAGVHDLPAGVQTLHPGVQSVPARGANAAPRSETNTSDQHVSSNRIDDGTHEDTAADTGKPWADKPTNPPTRRAGRFEPLAATLSTYQPAVPVHQPPADDRSLIATLIAPYRSEFGDAASKRASTSRILRLFAHEGVGTEAFAHLLAEAASRTRESQRLGTIEGHAFAYFISVLEHLLQPTLLRVTASPLTAQDRPQRSKQGEPASDTR